jgi:alpha-galactosidase
MKSGFFRMRGGLPTAARLCGLFVAVRFSILPTQAQILAPTPPMGWMSWNLFADKLNESDVHEMAQALVQSGMRDAGYRYILLDDGWPGGRDQNGQIYADLKKFPSGMKALAHFLHKRGLKLGLYSDAAIETCGGYTGSYGHESEDAKTFAAWGVDYLKYDYCGAPPDQASAKLRYRRMADALRSSGRPIIFSICEWGHREPWKWAASVGGQLWRCAGDIRDKWRDNDPNRRPPFVGAYGISDVIDDNSVLSKYAGLGRWNDMDMLVIGMYGKTGPSSMLGGIGCTNTEYQTQMSMWCMMASPLAASNDLRHMNESTRQILLNKELIAVDQDRRGRQAILKIKTNQWYVFVKPLTNGDFALSILNRGELTQQYRLDLQDVGMPGTYRIRDLWEHRELTRGIGWSGDIRGHETKVFRLTKG